MKKILLVFGIAALFAACGQKSAQQTATTETPAWTGVYSGITPCADCEGIQTSLELKSDKTYTLETIYLGKSDTVFQVDGNFTLDKDLVLLENATQNGIIGQYLVDDNTLTQLNNEGKVITGQWAEMYVLRK